MKALDRYIRRQTGKGLAYWMERIGSLCAKYGKPIKDDKKLSSCNPGAWMGVLSREVAAAIKERLAEQFDENITTAKVLSLIYTLWAYRICAGR